MAYTITSRFKLPQWNEDTDIFQRSQLTGAFANIEQLSAQDFQGTLAARPAAGVVGRYYQTTNDNGGYRLYRDTGTFWQEVLCHVDRSGTAAARPAAGTPGNYYYETDQDRLYRDNGSSWVEITTSTTFPVGSIILTATTNQPAGWLWCDGTAYATSTYPLLYKAIGRTYSPSLALVPSTQFCVPDLKSTLAKGAANIPLPGDLYLLADSTGAPCESAPANQDTFGHIILNPVTNRTQGIYLLGLNYLIKAN